MQRLPVEFVPKGWGFERWIVNKKEYCGKELFFIKGRKCSRHFHKLKDETFFIAEGMLRLQYLAPHEWNYDETKPPQKQEAAKLALHARILEPGDVFYVPPMMIHQMTGLFDTRLFEFSTEHFDSDSYRVVKGD